ncbi:hypothetical protein [Nonomuraea typhae]|uniref:hypothetical protein n=1 Tax=Nonomuraea typhae TaxID=2603600 RepID=UPI0012FAD979|nr:hypothetical protein [Nonomuraea typhae]
MVEAFLAGQELPDYAQDILGAIVDLLRQAHAADSGGVSAEYRTRTGQDVPDWMKQPPHSPEE